MIEKIVFLKSPNVQRKKRKNSKIFNFTGKVMHWGLNLTPGSCSLHLFTWVNDFCKWLELYKVPILKKKITRNNRIKTETKLWVTEKIFWKCAYSDFWLDLIVWFRQFGGGVRARCLALKKSTSSVNFFRIFRANARSEKNKSKKTCFSG